MKFHELDKNTPQSRKRVGRGIAAGGGKTAGRGTKGQKSRSGGSVRPGFEGGQNPLHSRLPKLRGFKSRRSQAFGLSTDLLERLGEKEVTPDLLLEKDLMTDRHSPVRLIKGAKEMTKAVVVNAHKASPAAVAAVESAGGKVNIIDYKPIAKATRASTAKG